MTLTRQPVLVISKDFFRCPWILNEQSGTTEGNLVKFVGETSGRLYFSGSRLSG